MPLTWDAVANTANYRVEYRNGTFGYWTLDADAVTTTSHTVDGLQCDTEYQFRVRFAPLGSKAQVPTAPGWPDS